MVLTISNRQRTAKVDTKLLRNFARKALPLCLDRTGADEAPLPRLEEVEVTFVGDRVISDLHARFMNVPGPTDVITFAHGEIVISATTAARQAAEFGQDFHHELGRYIVHGLLHLNGHQDATPPGAAVMWRAQEEILAAIWPM